MTTRQLPRTRPAENGEATDLDDTQPAEDQPSLSRGSGWDAVSRERASRSKGAHRLDIKDEEVLLKFLDAEPFGLYEQHWVGQRSYTCIEGTDSCPLCAIGYSTRYLVLFNVYDMKSGENKFWPAGPNAVREVEDLANNARYAPIDKPGLYFSIKRSKKDNGFFAFKVTPVKERDLAEDFPGIDPLTDEELKEATEHRFDESVIPYSTREQLAEVAGKLDEE